MKDYEDMTYFPTSEKLVNILCQKTQNTNKLFFRVMVGYYFSKLASMMRANIATHDRGKIPVNMYAINLAPSGQGKGHSTNIIEEQVIRAFRNRFLEETMPIVSQKNLTKLANKRALKKGTDPADELERIIKEYENQGELPFSFDSGTTPAIKQMRQKLLMADAGSINMEIDEIGSNLLGNVDALNTYLELYDVGKTKQKLVKNTVENTRSAEIEGRTPANMMLFGTPSKLLDGGRTEDEYLSMLDTGYARRCFFGYQTATTRILEQSAEEVYDMLTDTSSNTFIEQLSDQLFDLADTNCFAKELEMTKDVSLLVIEYRQKCELAADSLPDHQEIQKAELCHRYFKALKLAGAYAFIDGASHVTEGHLYNAIKLAEDSGKAFNQMLIRDRNYVKIAKYLSTCDREITHVDLMEDLPCYKGSENARRELINLATAWGHRNNIIIKRQLRDNIELLKGETLQEVDLAAVKVAYSTKLAEGYQNEVVNFNDLYKLTQQPNFHWVNHHLEDGYRKEDSAIPGCDYVVIDVDNGITMKAAQTLLKDYKYHMHTTKRHQTVFEGKHYGDRFRIILPLSHRVKLDAADYKEFMQNIYDWLPFEMDEQTNQRSRKWMTHPGEYHDNEGKLLDTFMFIPQTRKAEEQKQLILETSNLNNLERWFVANTAEGNRSHNLVRYGLMLVDSGFDFDTIRSKVMTLNNKLPEPLEEAEILATIMVTVNKAIAKR